MVPRTSLVTVESTASFEALLTQVALSGHSCYPVTGDSPDDIRGAIDFKDLAAPLAKGQITPQTTIEQWIKPVRFVSETTLLSELLPLMQRSALKMVIVVDEFGGTAGLVTFQDLIAEIIGDESEDETEEAAELTMLDEQTFLVQAQMNIEEVNELLNLTLPLSDEYQTLGGFLVTQLQKIPTQGETLQYNNLDFTVVSALGTRLYQIRIHRREPLSPLDVFSEGSPEGGE